MTKLNHPSLQEYHQIKRAAKARRRFPKRSFWKNRSPGSWSFYCPFCGIGRKIPYPPQLGLRHLLQIALTSVVFMLASWTWLEWKGIVIFVPLWGAFEFFYRSRVRGALACRQCGFDPYLYLLNVPRARAVIESHWRKKFAEKGIPYPEKATQGAEAKAPHPPSSPSSPSPVPATPASS